MRGVDVAGRHGANTSPLKHSSKPPDTPRSHPFRGPYCFRNHLLVQLLSSFVACHVPISLSIHSPDIRGPVIHPLCLPLNHLSPFLPTSIHPLTHSLTHSLTTHSPASPSNPFSDLMYILSPSFILLIFFLFLFFVLLQLLHSFPDFSSSSCSSFSSSSCSFTFPVYGLRDPAPSISVEVIR